MVSWVVEGSAVTVVFGQEVDRFPWCVGDIQRLVFDISGSQVVVDAKADGCSEEGFRV